LARNLHEDFSRLRDKRHYQVEAIVRRFNSINISFQYIDLLSIDFIDYCTYTVFMPYLSFIWDPQKNRQNSSKHDGIDFEEAKTVFYDENARLIYDPEHSIDEDRFIILGLSNKLRLLIVCHCYKESESVIRIISARKATTKEAKIYEEKRNA
jgi:uncharacterized DUF497 family protein